MPVERKGVRALQIWCRRVTESYDNVNILDFSHSWKDGLGFCALIHHFRPSLIDFPSLKSEDVLKNNELAFSIAEDQLGIPSLLDAQDMVDCDEPDKFSVITYVSQFYHLLKDEDDSCQSPSLNRKNKINSEGEMDSNQESSSENTPVGTPKSVPKRLFTCNSPVLRNNKFSPDLSVTLNESTHLKCGGGGNGITISAVCQDLTRQLYIKEEKES